MRKTPWLTLAVGMTAWLAPGQAQAAPGEGFHPGGFVYGAAPMISVPVGDEGFADLTNEGVQWGFGGGYMFVPTKHFMATVGGAFEHTWINFEVDALGGNIIRLLPEVRIGGGTRRLFGYGYAQPGLGLAVFSWEVLGVRGDDSEPGFNMGVGGGFQGIVWKNLMVGGEVGVDLGFYVDDEDDVVGDDTAEIYTLDIKLLVGWYF